MKTQCPYYLALARVLTGMQPDPQNLHIGIVASELVYMLGGAKILAPRKDHLIRMFCRRIAKLRKIDDSSAKNLAYWLGQAIEVVRGKPGKQRRKHAPKLIGAEAAFLQGASS